MSSSLYGMGLLLFASVIGRPALDLSLEFILEADPPHSPLTGTEHFPVCPTESAIAARERAVLLSTKKETGPETCPVSAIYSGLNIADRHAVHQPKYQLVNQPVSCSLVSSQSDFLKGKGISRGI